MMTVTAMRKPKAETVGSLIDAMYDVREEIRAKEAETKLLGAQKDELELRLLSLMDAEGVTKSTGRHASAGVTEAVRPNVTDWDSFYAYIHKNKYWHLLERRPSVTGCRELFETKGLVPGVEPFIKRTINLRNL